VLRGLVSKPCGEVGKDGLIKEQIVSASVALGDRCAAYPPRGLALGGEAMWGGEAMRFGVRGGASEGVAGSNWNEMPG